jgi:CYTH domain-containing protein
MRHLVAEIAAFLGEPAPYETRRRFLVEYPDTALLEELPDCYREEIEQIYLHAPQNEEIRLRRRRSGEDCVYYITRTKTEGGHRRLESEGRLTEREYRQFLGNADPGMKPIHKTRWSIVWHGHYYEIDIYPFWKDRAVLEVLLRDEEEEVIIPDLLQVIREVTDDREYEAASLASLQSRAAMPDQD